MLETAVIDRRVVEKLEEWGDTSPGLSMEFILVIIYSSSMINTSI